MTRLGTIFSGLRTRARTGILVEAAAVLAAVFLVYAALSFAADRSLRLEAGYRLLLLLLFLVAVGRMLYLRLLAPMAVELTDEEMALAVERADPGVKQALISAVQFEAVLVGGAATVESRELMSRVVREVDQRVGSMATRSALEGRRVAGFGGLLALVVLLLAAWAAFWPGTVKLWALRNLALSSIEWPRATRLSFLEVGEAKHIRLPEGDDITLRVRAEGAVPEQVGLRYEFESGESGHEPMTLTGRREFTLTLSSVLENAVLTAEGGDARPVTMYLDLVARPRIEGFSVTLAYPDYMHREAKVLPETQGDIRVPRGGHLEIKGRSTKPLERAWLAFGTDQRAPVEVTAGGKGFEARFSPEATGLLTLHLFDRDRLDAAKPTKLFLRLVEDRAPSLQFRAMGVGSMLTPVARIPGRLTLRDDYGLEQVRAWFRLTTSAEPGAAGKSAKEMPFEPAVMRGLEGFHTPATAFSTETLFDLEPMSPDANPASERNRVKPGQFLAIKFSARDNFGPGSPHTGESDPLTFRIVSREQLMNDLARRQAEMRRELTQIRDDEKADRNLLDEILSPAAAGNKAKRAKVRVQAKSRQQRARGKRVGGIAERYDRLLEEFLNNRILEPNRVRGVQEQIPSPLRRLAREGFPTSAELVSEFADSGQKDIRQAVVASYDTIIKKLEQVLEHMQELENLATLLESLRQVIKVEDSAIESARKRREKAAVEVFGPGGGKNHRRDNKDRPEEKKR